MTTPSASASGNFVTNQAVLDCSPDGILIVNHNNCALYVNDALSTMFQLAQSVTLNDWPHLLLKKPYDQEVYSSLQAFWSNASTSDILFDSGRELIARRDGGTHFPIHLTFRSFEQDSENFVIGFVRDISKQLERQTETQNQNEHLKALINFSPTGICTINDSFELMETNLAFAKMIGRPVQDIVGHRFTEFAHPEDVDKIERAACQNFLDKLDHYTLHTRHLHSDGHTVHTALTIGLIRDTSGRPQYAIANVQDLTQNLATESQLKEQQHQLNHLERLSILGEMSAGIAHEIDQPLTAITNYAQSAIRFISADKPRPERAIDALQLLSQEAQRGGAVIQRVRDLSRQRPGEKKRVDCSDLIDKVEELIRFDARSHRVTIRMLLSRKLPQVLGDPIQLQQVVLNLVRNALDASRHATSNDIPEVTVRTATKENGDVLVAVTDQGAGVDDAIAEHLFKPFSTNKTSGVGLGLSISHSIVTAHGGQLAFKNNRAGGATFYFTLPPASEQ